MVLLTHGVVIFTLSAGSLTSRRMRTAAWSAHYSKTGDWITMLITCPIVILLQEVQIVPHNSSPTGEFAGFNIEVLGGQFNHVFSGFLVF